MKETFLSWILLSQLGNKSSLIRNRRLIKFAQNPVKFLKHLEKFIFFQKLCIVTSKYFLKHNCQTLRLTIFDILLKNITGLMYFYMDFDLLLKLKCHWTPGTSKKKMVVKITEGGRN